MEMIEISSEEIYKITSRDGLKQLVKDKLKENGGKTNGN